MREILKLARLEEGTIISVANVNGIYFAKVKIDNFHGKNFPPAELPSFIMLSQLPINPNTETKNIPKKGARVVVALKNPEQIESGGYILGYIFNPMDQLIKKENEIKLSEGSYIIKTESNSGFIVENERKDFSAFASDSYLRLNDKKVEIKKNESGFEILDKMISIFTKDKSSSLVLSNKESVLYCENGNLSCVNGNGAQIFKALRKEEKYSGKATIEASLIEQKSQQRVITSGYIKYNAINGNAFGNENTIEFNSLIGNIVVSATSGDIKIQNFNPLNSIEIFNGTNPNIKISGIKIDSDLIEIKNNNPTGKIEITNQFGDIKISSLTNGNIEILNQLGDIKISNSSGNIEIEAILNKIIMKALAGIEIESKNKIDINSELTAKLIAKIIDIGEDSTTIMNLKSKIINSGSESTTTNNIKGSVVNLGNSPVGAVVTTATSPFIDLITGAPQMGVPTVLA